MNIENIKKTDCCGCTGCKSICPQNAITMQPDEQGFLYPSIDEEKCNDCGLCFKVCTASNSYKKKAIDCFAAKNKDAVVIANSSSGGVSNALAKLTIDNGGVVYGVAYDDELNVVTMKAESYSELEKFYGSKYVQTDERDCFSNIYNDLKKNKNVLFFGTSCHVAGLLSFLEKKRCDVSGLITVDLICHGVPSPKLFREYISFIGGKEKIKNVHFRNKKDKSGSGLLTAPWRFGTYNCGLEYKNGKREVNSLKSRLYLNLFTSNNCLRPSCYQCQYIGEEKPADITIADYWGIEEAHPEMADNYGVSALIIHAGKGLEFLNSCKDLEVIGSTIEKIARKQGMMSKASPKAVTYEQFWRDYKKKGFAYVAKKYGGYNFRGLLRNSTFLHGLWTKIRYGNKR